jgi:hypothetical protein
MKEIDRLLKQWIPVNTIIRGEIRAAIVKEINKYKDIKKWEKTKQSK